MKSKNIIKLFIILLLSNCHSNDKKSKITNGLNKSDSIFPKKYFKDGLLESKGYLTSDSLKIGKWDYFKPNSMIYKTIEYKIINGEQYTNQSWYFNKTKEDIIKKFGNYYKIKGLDNLLNLNDTVLVTIDYKRILSSNSNIILLTNKSINKQFSNLISLPLDTIYGTDKFNFFMILKNKGKFSFRGIIEEYYYKEPNKLDTTNYRGKYTFIDKEYFVN